MILVTYGRPGSPGVANATAPATFDAATATVGVSEATTNSVGVIQLSGDLAGTAMAPRVPQLSALSSQIAAETGRAEAAEALLVPQSDITRPTQVRAVATGNVAALSGVQTVDGVGLVAGDRVLLTGQSTGSQNGVWLVQSGAWTRPSDYPSGSAIPSGKTIEVLAGTVNALTSWEVTGSGNIDTAVSTWTQLHTTLLTTTTGVSTQSAPTTDAPALGLVFPEAHGAKGDGVTDDSAALAAAASALPIGHILWLSAGKSYAVKAGASSAALTMATASTRIAGGGKLVLLASASAFAQVVAVTAADVTIERVSFDTTAGNQTAAVWLNGAVRPTVRDCTFTNPQDGGVYIVNGCQHVAVQNNRIYGAGWGVVASDSQTSNSPFTDLTVTGNLFTGAGAAVGDAVEFNTPNYPGINFLVANNTISNYLGTTQSNGFGVAAANCTQGLISGNRIDTCQTGIHLENQCADVSVPGNTVLGCANSGIEVQPLTISGNPCLRISIVGNTVHGCCTAPYATTTVASASNGVTLPTSTINVIDTTNFPTSGTVLLLNATGTPQIVTYTGKTGTTLTGCTGGVGALATGNCVSSTGRGLGGIQVGQYLGGAVHGVTITGNTASNCQGASTQTGNVPTACGIYLYAPTLGTLSANVANNNGLYGIYAISATQHVIIGNVATDTQTTKTQQYGLALTGSNTSISLLFNEFEGNLNAANILDTTAGGTPRVTVGSSGLQYGSAATKQGWYGAAPIVQPSAVGAATGYAAGTTAATFHEDDTYTGNVGTTAYTLNGIVAALKNLGLIKS